MESKINTSFPLQVLRETPQGEPRASKKLRGRYWTCSLLGGQTSSNSNVGKLADRVHVAPTRGKKDFSDNKSFCNSLFRQQSTVVALLGPSVAVLEDARYLPALRILWLELGQWTRPRYRRQPLDGPASFGPCRCELICNFLLHGSRRCVRRGCTSHVRPVTREIRTKRQAETRNKKPKKNKPNQPKPKARFVPKSAASASRKG